MHLSPAGPLLWEWFLLQALWAAASSCQASGTQASPCSGSPPPSETECTHLATYAHTQKHLGFDASRGAVKGVKTEYGGNKYRD